MDVIRPVYVFGIETHFWVTKDDTMTVFTDGASSGNGTSRAYAGVGVFWGPNDER
jgi:hypothetical protein